MYAVHVLPLPPLLLPPPLLPLLGLLLQIDDPSVFPGQFGEPFPPNFHDVVRTIFKRLFRVYAHIYHSHFKQVCSLGEEAHLNTCFKHFIIFIRVSWWTERGKVGRLASLHNAQSLVDATRGA